MSIPEGSRQSTSARSLSAMRSVGQLQDGRCRVGHAQQRANVTELEAAVDEDHLEGRQLRHRHGQVEGHGGLAETTLGRVDGVRPRGQVRRRRAELLLRGLDGGHEVEAAEGHRQDPHDAHAGTHLDRLLGHRQDHDGQVDAGLAHPLGDLEPVHLALQQGIDHDHVRAHLLDLVQRLAPIGHDVEQLHLILGVQQVADIRRDLGHVLDEEQACLGADGSHRVTIANAPAARPVPHQDQRGSADGPLPAAPPRVRHRSPSSSARWRRPGA